MRYEKVNYYRRWIKECSILLVVITFSDSSVKMISEI